ncbi:FecR family protein [Zobellia sp. OII3]|uniref:FecR family protein n=1 Tax=Zobellia sp. OII3 TaxID=2034520 RepID=UPI0013748218|nr:FecR domain-containing protein [Zobellia sp. OII3]
MNKKDILRLIEGHLDDSKKKEVIDFLLKNPKALKEFQRLKATHVAAAIRGDNKVSNRKKLYIRVFKYAAVVSILAATWFYSSSHLNNEISNVENAITLVTTSIGEKKKVVLSDGTVVTVNSNSVLSYPTHFIGSTREVVLRGEAFFDVTENKEAPFIVKTNEGMDIKVLGTTFNVKSYPEDSNIETTLVTGKVEVVEREDNKTVFLYPSQRATYVKNDDQLIIDKVNTEEHVSWKDGKLIYDETPFTEVIKGLERMYDVKFKIKSKEIFDYRYTGTFDNLSIEEAIYLLELSSPINCHLKEKKVVLDIQK